MLKKIVSVFAAVILLFQVPIANSSVAYADEGTGDSFPFFTDVQLIDTDTGQALGGPDVTEVSKDAHVKIVYTFAIPDNVDVAEGDTYSFVVPDQIKLSGDVTGYELRDEGGTVFAHLDLTADGQGTVTFTGAAGSLRDVGGAFEVWGQFDANNIDNTDTVEIPFTIGTEVKTIDVHFQQPDATNAKAGVYDASTGTVTWTVTLNSNKTTVKDATLVDVITPGAVAGEDRSQTYVDGSFKVVGANSGSIFNSAETEGNQGSGTFSYVPAVDDPATTGTLSYTFENTFEEAVTVTYQTVLADPSQYFGKTVSNEAVFSHDGITQNVSGIVSVPTPDYITKTGEYNEETGQIDWRIEFNKEGLSLHGVKVSDTLTGGLVLDTGSVKLDNVAVPLGVNGAAGTFTYDQGTGLFVYHVGDIDAPQVLTFSTDLPDDYWQQNHNAGEFSNAATMTSTDNSYLEGGATDGTSGIGPGNSVIEKQSLGYDVDTHRITWQIVVNANNNKLPDATITDTVPKGQKYVGAFTITEGAPVNTLTGEQSFKVTEPTDPASDPTVLEYHFGEEIAVSYTITFQTEITDPTVWAGNTGATYKNKVVLEPGGEIPSSNSEGSQPVNPNVVKKSASYDYTTHELTWAITVNQSQVPLTGVVVTDALTGEGLDDFSLDPTTISVDGNRLAEAAGESPEVGTYRYDADTKTLVVNLGDLKSSDASQRTKVITFTMKLNKQGTSYDSYFNENGDKTVANTAEVSSQENSSTKARGVQIIHNKLVDKVGYYTSGKAYIDWAVQVNQNGIALKGLTLTDELPVGLELDTSSVKLYEQELQADGSLRPAPSYAGGELSVVGESVDLGSENVSYDAVTREFVFTMPEGVGDSQPCLLVFRTTVDAAYAQGKSFSNSITLSGSGHDERSDSNGQDVHFSTLGGSAWGSTGNIALVKNDKDAQAPLAGAVFGLYDSYGNLVRISAPTDGDGETSFDHINYNTRYSVKEIGAPSDYELGDSSFLFQLNKDDTVQLYDAQGNPLPASDDPLLFSNDRKVGTITFMKTGDGDSPLSGAEFTLYDEQGVAVEGIEPQTSGADGRVTFENVPYGTYFVKETGVPIGYRPITLTASLHDDNEAIVTEGEDHTLDLGVQPDMSVGSLTLTKYSAEFAGGSTQTMPGVSFEILDSDGKVVREATATDGQGKIVFDDLEPGVYVLHEASTPADYQPAEDYEFTIDAASAPLERQLTHEITNLKKAGTITLSKVDIADGTTPLAGAEFTLYDASGENVVSNAQGPLVAVSDAQGIVTFEDVPYGDYLVKETGSPDNYHGVVSVTASLHGETLALGSFDNTRSTGSIRFTKTDGHAPLAGAVFELSGNGIEPLQATSNEDGIVEFADIPYQDTPYTVKEVATPADYYRAISDFQVTINDESTVGNQGDLVLADPVVDVPLGSIQLTKTNADGTIFLPGAVFELLDEEGTVVQTQETDAFGVLSFSDLVLKPAGDTIFTVHEKDAPLNYDVAADQEVVLSHESDVRSMDVEVRDALKIGTINLTKVTQDGLGLQGATFGLYDSVTLLPIEREGVPVTALSDEQGAVSFTEVPFGSYIVKETSAPADYAKSDVAVPVDLTEDNPAVVAGTMRVSTPVVNTIKTAAIELEKVNEEGNPLEGATFVLYDAQGVDKVMIGGKEARATSDAAGRVSFTEVPYGDYLLVESDPPAGYKAVEPIRIAIHDDNTALSQGVLDVGKVVDQRVPAASSLTKTGDGMGSLFEGLGLLAVFGGILVSGMTVRRSRRKA